MDWYTPQPLFDKLNAEFGFTVDVCADIWNAKCQKFYSPRWGLEREWVGVCWMNPPYGKEIKDWMKKALEESRLGATVVALIPNRSNAPWWHEYVMKAHEIRFVKKKVAFVPSETTPNKGVPFWGVCIAVFMPGDNENAPKVSSWEQPRKERRRVGTR